MGTGKKAVEIPETFKDVFAHVAFFERHPELLETLDEAGMKRYQRAVTKAEAYEDHEGRDAIDLGDPDNFESDAFGSDLDGFDF